jgi:hypothetical protein
MTVINLQNAIAAAALAALAVPAGFAQDTKADQQSPAAECAKLSGFERENCLDRLRAEGKLPPKAPGGAVRPVPPPAPPTGTPLR